MITLRSAAQRGKTEFGWLESRHSFSFGDYHDPKHMGFGPLRVINEDRVRPGAGFNSHGHQDMEIISYVLEGALEHKDSTGAGSVIRPGGVQIMSAGTGVRHSEFNHSKTEPVHFLQIWIVPDRMGVAPRYDQRSFPPSEQLGRLRLIGSPNGRNGSIIIYQDAEIYEALLDANAAVSHGLEPGRKGWVQVVRGAVDVNGEVATAGDGVAVERDNNLIVTSRQNGSQLLLFDLP